MLIRMRIGLLFCAFLLAGAALAEEERFVELSDWAQPRDALAVSRHPVLRAAVTVLLQDSDAQLELRYPGGDEGSLRAGELRAWLVALGIDPARVALMPGSSAPDRIDLSVTPR